MRRALEIISALAFIGGPELAAGTFSYTLDSLERTVRLMVAGESFSVPAPAFIVGSGFMVLGLTLGALTLWTRVAANTVQPGPICPRCGSETKRTRRSLHHKMLAAVMGHRLTRRSCSKCRWAGLSLKH